jgi:hypothetical protein
MTTGHGADANHRVTLHRVCAHVLGRRRFAGSGRFGLRAGPGGIATPAFGDAPEVVRISGSLLMREVGADVTWTPIDGTTLRQLASFVGEDIDAPFDCGADTPSIGDPDEPLQIPVGAVDDLSAWFALAWRVLDRILENLGEEARATTIQLWPEHFDAATTVTLPGTEPANLGFSPGDTYEPEPYVYVGPSSAKRPGDPSLWNAPFGALVRRTELAREGTDPTDACAEFLSVGLRALT